MTMLWLYVQYVITFSAKILAKYTLQYCRTMEQITDYSTLCSNPSQVVAILCITPMRHCVKYILQNSMSHRYMDFSPVLEGGEGGGGISESFARFFVLWFLSCDEHIFAKSYKYQIFVNELFCIFVIFPQKKYIFRKKVRENFVPSLPWFIGGRAVIHAVNSILVWYKYLSKATHWLIFYCNLSILFQWYILL